MLSNELDFRPGFSQISQMNFTQFEMPVKAVRMVQNPNDVRVVTGC
jgi:hypothetical protein